MDQRTLIQKILSLGWVKRTDRVLVTCGGKDDDQILKDLKFTNYLITSAYKKLPGVKRYKQADAQKLPYRDNSFDAVIVSAGLHHCDSPHLALTEMYRVAKKTVIVHEAQDSLLVRLLIKFGLAFEYETGFEKGHGGGLNDTDIPNFIYRWTRREVEKTIYSYDPTRIHDIKYFRSFRFYPFYLDDDEYLGKNIIFKILGKKLTAAIFNYMVQLINSVASGQGNDFAFIIRKNKSRYQKWINPKQLTTSLAGRFQHY